MTQVTAPQDTDFFTDPVKPSVMRLVAHEHDWVEVGAERNGNGTWSSVWGCTQCPDIGIGGFTGPVPVGFCFRCHWVQKRPGRKRCEECKAPREAVKQP